jgi:hypothetical protein
VVEYITNSGLLLDKAPENCRLNNASSRTSEKGFTGEPEKGILSNKSAYSVFFLHFKKKLYGTLSY